MIRVRNLNTEKEGRLYNITDDKRYVIKFDDGEVKDYAESTYKRWFEHTEVDIIGEVVEEAIENDEVFTENDDLEVTPIEEIVERIEKTAVIAETEVENKEIAELPDDITEIAEGLYRALKEALPEGVEVKANPTYNLFTINKYSYLAVTFQKTGIRVGLNPEYLDEDVLENGRYFPNWNWAIKFHKRIRNMAELDEWIPIIVELGNRIKESRGI